MPTHLDLAQHFTSGLRPKDLVPVNAPYLKTCTNLYASERKLKELPTHHWPAGFPTVSGSWPPAEVFHEERSAIAMVDEVLSDIDVDALTSDEIDISQAVTPTNMLDNGTLTGSPAVEWTLGAGWAVAPAAPNATAIAATTATSTLKQTLANMATGWTSAVKYTVMFTLSGVSAGSLTVGTNTDDDQGETYSAAGTYVAIVTADAHADGLVFTGTGFTGTIDNIKTYALFTVAGTGPWHFAAFMDSWFATNGTSLVFDSPSNEGNVVVGESTTIQFQTVCNWNNRIVFGGLSGTRLASDSVTKLYNAWVRKEKRNVQTNEDDALGLQWLFVGPPVGGDSAIPNAAVLALFGMPSDDHYTQVYESQMLTWVEQGLVDFIPIRNVGSVEACKVYEGELIVYGTAGVSRIRYTEIGPLEADLSSVGILGRGALNGDMDEHLYVGKDQNLWMIGEGAVRYSLTGIYSPELVGIDCFRLGFYEYISTLGADDFTFVSYDAGSQFYWISDDGDSFMLSRTGLSRSLGSHPSCSVRMPGYATRIGAAVAGAATVTIRTHPFDMGRRDPFNVDMIALATTDTAAVATDRWKAIMYSKLRKQDAESTFDAVYADSRGVAAVNLCGIEHSIELVAADRTKVDLDGAIVQISNKQTNMRPWLDKLGL